MADVIHMALTLTGVALLLATLPLVAELLVLSAAAATPRRKQAQGEAERLHLAVIIPAHNEELLIGNCVRWIMAAKDDHVKVYVVAHNCSDETADRADYVGAQVLTLEGEGGKGRALDYGFREAVREGAEALLVVDADSLTGPGMLRRVASALANGAEAVQCRYEVANAGSTPRTRLAALAFLGMNVVRPLGRSRLGCSCGIFGNGFALRADTLARIPYTANSLVEDLEYHLKLVRAGVKVEFLADASVFGEMPEGDAGARSQRARWEGGRIRMRHEWTWPLMKEVLRGRLRMLEPMADLLALPLASGVIWLMAALGLGLAAHQVWLWGYAVAGVLSVGLYLVVAASLSAEPMEGIKALLGAPAYVLWKLTMIPRTRRAARASAAWVRTRRNVE